MEWLRNRCQRIGGAAPDPGARAGYAAALLGIAGATAVLTPPREALGLLNIGLLFLALVVVIAARWGWGPGLFASVVANLALNVFFVPPRFHVRVQEPDNVLALLVFLAVTALTSALLARANAGESAARRREQEVTVLYELSRLVIVHPSMASTLATICDRVREVFAAEACVVLLPAGESLAPAAGSGPRTVTLATAFDRRAAWEAFTRGETVALGERGDRRRPRLVQTLVPRERPRPVLFVPLRVIGQTVGVLQVVGPLTARLFTSDQVRLLEAFADEAALAVDRDRLLHEAARAESLEETDRLKTVLLSAVSHDLRTPLTAILTSVSSLLQSEVSWDDAMRQEFLSAIESQTLRLTRLVNNLLDLSRIEGGALQPETDWFNIAELLHSVVEIMEPALKEHPVTLTIAADSGDAPFDYVQISQVFTNLLENAAKFSPAGSAIMVEAERVGETMRVRVIDHGAGLPDAERAQVFEKFYRAGRTADRVPGTGLGLAICKGFVEMNGGAIDVQETPGGGATFVVTLPAPPPPISKAALLEERQG